jgi:tetratricopeptide (TPR) repeat protein
MIDQVQPPLAFRMIEAAKLMDWDGTLEHEEFDLLLGSIGRILGQNCAAGTEDKTPHIALEIDPQYQQALNDKGMDFYNLGSYQEALDAFDKALKNNPLDKLLWYNKGSALGNLGRYQEAISAYDKALKIDPQFKQAWYNKGGALGNLGNYQEALVASDKALKIG